MPVNIGRAPHVAVDRFGRLLEPGHLVMYRPPMDLVFEVMDVRPVLNPALVASGMQAMQVTLRAQFPVQVASAQPNAALVIIGDSEARQQALATAGKDGQPKTEPPAAAEIPTAAGPKLVITDAEGK